MADKLTPKLANDAGVDEITIGVKEFECIGALPPYDHPHVYLDMGRDDEIICPYCSTRYRYSDKLSASASKPAGAVTHL
jgi:uncharacterized Zn-finger protein